MNLSAVNEYAEWTDTTWLGSTGKEAVMIAALGLGGEAGEVQEIIKKWARGDGPLDTHNLRKELGDVLYYLARQCREHNISLESVFLHNMIKIRMRQEKGTQRGNGDHR